MKRFFFPLLIAWTLIACSVSTPQPEPSKTKLPALEGDWNIKMIHSGGIAGVSRSIEISSTGTYTVIDERSGQTVTREFGSTQLAQLKEIVESSVYVAPTGPAGVCADCFQYSLFIQGNGEVFEAGPDDISLSDSGLDTLIMYLRETIDRTLVGN